MRSHLPQREVPAVRWGRRWLAVVGLLAVAGQGCVAGRPDAARQIVADDGVKIGVWVLKSNPGPASQPAVRPRGTAVLLHPWLAGKGWFLPLGRRLAAEGWDVVLVDLRGHGESGGVVCWGAKEKHDVRKVVDALVVEGLIQPRIFVMGASLGGCVAIQYAALDRRCKGVLALAPPTGIEGVVRCAWPFGSEQFIATKVLLEAQRGGYFAADASAVSAAKRLKCPLVIVHGRLDMTVPYAQCEQIYAAAAGPKRMIRIWADHGGVQTGRDERLVEQLNEMAAMAAESQPAGRP
jgi:uncharacterized protein